MFSALLSPNFMPSFGKIVGAVFEICRYVRTHPRTHKSDLIGPSVFNRGPIGTLHVFFYKHRDAKHRRPENRPKVKHLLSIGVGRNLYQKLSIPPPVACDLQKFRLRRPNFAKFSPAAGFFSKINNSYY